MIKQFVIYLALLTMLTLLLWRCIEPYDLPSDGDDFESSLVVDGMINNDDSIQVITISQSSAINSAGSSSVKGLTGCDVVVSDDKGHHFEFADAGEGKYHCAIPEQYFYVGNIFTLKINTPEGEEYVSEPEELLSVPPVDSVYYIPVLNENNQEVGIRFLIDVKGAPDDCRNYKWKVSESYEYQASFPIHFIYRGDVVNPEIRDFDVSQKVCYVSNTLKGYNYIVSTDNLQENKYIGLELNSVAHAEKKLCYRYCLLVKQYSLTNAAAQFWSQLKLMQEEKGMFDGQPVVIVGNVKNRHDSGERVLGYFGASMVSEKRVAVTRRNSLGYYECELSGVNVKDLDDFAMQSTLDDPLYLLVYYNAKGDMIEIETADDACFDCTLRGGETRKPAHWDDEDIIVLDGPVE